MNIYDFTVKAQDGSDVALSAFAGKACIDGGMHIAADAGADSIKALIK